MVIGLHGPNMENAVFLVEKDTNTEHENALEQNTAERIVLEITKKQLTARLVYTAQLMDTGQHGAIMEIAALPVEKDTNTEQENVLERNMVEKIVLEITKKQLTARLMFTAQLTDTGQHGAVMENAALPVEKDTNTEQENVLERNTVEKIVLEITKKQLTARLVLTAQLMDIGLNGKNGQVVARHAAMEFKHV